MGRRKKVIQQESPIVLETTFEHEGFVIEAGDIVKVRGEYGAKFKVRGIATNIKTGSTWVDLFEIFRGKPQQFRAFKKDRIKRVPQKGKRAKRVDN